MKNPKPADTTLLTRYGRRKLACMLHGREGWTMQEIGELFGISKVAVFRMLWREKQAGALARKPRASKPRLRNAQAIPLSSVFDL